MAVKSAAFALSCGATVVSLIPTRRQRRIGAPDGNRRISPLGLPPWKRPELALNLCGGGRIFADTWDLEQFSTCPVCFEKRRQRFTP